MCGEEKWGNTHLRADVDGVAIAVLQKENLLALHQLGTAQGKAESLCGEVPTGGISKTNLHNVADNHAPRTHKRQERVEKKNGMKTQHFSDSNLCSSALFIITHADNLKPNQTSPRQKSTFVAHKHPFRFLLSSLFSLSVSCIV